MISRDCRRDLCIAALIFVVALIPRFYKIASVSVWLDEDAQALVGLHHPNRTIPEIAADQQQPPLDYYLTAAGLKTFGFTEFGLRFHPALFGALGAAVLYALLRRMKTSRGISACMGLAWSLQPWLVAHAQDGRPFSTALLAELLVFHALLSCEQKVTVRSCILLFATICLFIFTISVHPGIVLLALWLPFVPAAFTKKRRVFWALTGAGALACLVYAPTLLSIAHASASYFSDKPKPFPWGRFAELISGFNQIFDASRVLAVALLGLAVVQLRMAPEKRRWVAATLLYPLIFIFVFLKFLPYEMRPRYLMFFLPLFYVAAALGLQACRPRLGVALAAGLVLVTTLHFTRSAPRFYVAKMISSQDWRSLYDYFDRFAADHGTAYVFNATRPEEWRQDGFVGLNFHYRNQIPTVRCVSQWQLRNRGALDIMRNDLRDGIEPKQVFIVNIDWWSHLPFPAEAFTAAGAEVKTFNGLRVVRLENTQGLEQTLRMYFDVWNANTREEPSKQQVHAALAMLDHEARHARP